MKFIIRKTLISLSFLTILTIEANSSAEQNADNSAQPCTGCDCPGSSFPTGFYGGAKGGYNKTSTKFLGSFEDGLDPIVNNSGTNTASGAIGSLFLGYQKTWDNCCLLGFELEGFFGSGHTKKVFTPDPVGLPEVIFDLKSRRRWGVMPSIVIGRVLSDHLMGYLKLGLNISKHRFTVTDRERTERFVKNRVMFGLNPAIGFKCAFTPRVSFLGELGYGLAKRKSKLMLERDPADGDYFFARMKNPRGASAQIGISVNLG